MKKRISLDHRGRPVVEIRNRDGIYEPEVDRTALAKYKLDELTVSTGSRRASSLHQKVGSNPYQGASVPESKKLRKRSGLDYLRALSAEISKGKGGK